jgi:hypothetical protein
MPVRRVALDNGKTFDLEVEQVHVFGGKRPLARLRVYRVIEDGRDRYPLRRVDGGELEFTATTEDAVFSVACEVLQWMHDTSLRSVS